MNACSTPNPLKAYVEQVYNAIRRSDPNLTVEEAKAKTSEYVKTALNNEKALLSKRAGDIKDLAPLYIPENTAPKQESNYEIAKGVYANKQQADTIDKLLAFASKEVNTKDDRDNIFILTGRGGTGKTTIINKFIEEHLKSVSPKDRDEAKSKIFFAAPTHVAAAVLEMSLNPDTILNKPGTIHSLFGLALNEYDDSFKPLQPGSLIVVDEASMISERTLDKLLRASRGSKIIFMGDSAQNPPSRNRREVPDPIARYANSPVFTIHNNPNNKSNLTQLMRQNNGSPIVNLTNVYTAELDSNKSGKDLSESPVPNLEGQRNTVFNPSINAGVIFSNNPLDEVLNAFINDYENNPTGTVIVTYNKVTNPNAESVGSINKKVRRLIRERQGKADVVDMYAKGDILVGYSTSRDSSNEPFILNGGKYRVESAPKKSQILKIDLDYLREIFADNLKKLEPDEMPRLVLQDQDLRFFYDYLKQYPDITSQIEYRELEVTDLLTGKTLTANFPLPDAITKYNLLLGEDSNITGFRSYNNYLENLRGPNGEQVLEAFNRNIPETVVNHMKISMLVNKFVKTLKSTIQDTNFAYAMSNYKVQGSTYRNTYVLEGNIFNGTWESQKFRMNLMYVASSRPTSKLVIHNAGTRTTVDEDFNERTVRTNNDSTSIKNPAIDYTKQGKVTYSTKTPIQLPKTSEVVQNLVAHKNSLTVSQSNVVEEFDEDVGTPSIPPEWENMGYSEDTTSSPTTKQNAWLQRIAKQVLELDPTKEEDVKAIIATANKRNISTIVATLRELAEKINKEKFATDTISGKLKTKYSLKTSLSNTIGNPVYTPLIAYVNNLNGMEGYRNTGIIPTTVHYNKQAVDNKEKAHSIHTLFDLSGTKPLEQSFLDSNSEEMEKDISTNGLLSIVENFFGKKTYDGIPFTPEQLEIINRLKGFRKEFAKKFLGTVNSVGTDPALSSINNPKDKLFQPYVSNDPFPLLTATGVFRKGSSMKIVNLIDPNITSLMFLEGFKWLVTSGRATLSNDESTIKKNLGLSDNDVLNPILIESLSTGIPRYSLASRLGKPIVSKLGLTPLDTTDASLKEQLATSIGLRIIGVLHSMGLVEDFEVDGNTLSGLIEGYTSHEVNPVYTRLKVTENEGETVFNDLFLQMENLYKDNAIYGTNSTEYVLEVLNGASDRSTTPHFVVPKVRNTFLSAPEQISPEVKESIDHLQKQEWFFNNNVKVLDGLYTYPNGKPELDVKKAEEIRELLRKMLGYTYDLKTKPAIKHKSIRGKNLSIDKDIDGLFTFYGMVLNEQMFNPLEVTKIPFHFKYVQQSNSRVAIQSSLFNPQASKILHRFFVSSENWEAKVIKGSNDLTEKLFKLAVGQGLGISIDKLNWTKSLEEFDKKVSDGTLTRLAEEYFKTNKLTEEIVLFASKEGGAHGLKALYELGRWLSTANKATFTTDMPIEVDAVNQGVALGHMQAGILSEEVKRVLAATGIFFDNSYNSFSDYKDNPNNRDNYEQANDTNNRWVDQIRQAIDPNGTSQNNLRSIKNVVIRMVTDTYSFLGKSIDSERASDNIDRDATRLARGILQIGVEEATVNRLLGSSNSNLRDLFKDPIMQATYQAGVPKLVKFISSSILLGVRNNKGFLDRWVTAINDGNTQEAAEYLALFNKVVNVGMDYVGQGMQLPPLPEGFNPLENNLDYNYINAFQEGIFNSYGGVYSYTLAEFKSRIKQFTGWINDSISTIFHIFNAVLTDKQNKLAGTKGYLSVEDVRTLSEDPELLALFPYISTGNSTTASEGIAAIKEAKTFDRRTDVQVDMSPNTLTKIGIDGNVTSPKSAKANARRIAYQEPGASAIVKMTQAHDSNQMMRLVKDKYLLHIFDALVTGINNVVTYAHDLNRITYDQNHRNDFSFSQSVQEKLQDTLEVIENNPSLISAINNYAAEQVRGNPKKYYKNSDMEQLSRASIEGVLGGLDEYIHQGSWFDPRNVTSLITSMANIAFDNTNYIPPIASQSQSKASETMEELKQADNAQVDEVTSKPEENRVVPPTSSNQDNQSTWENSNGIAFNKDYVGEFSEEQINVIKSWINKEISKNSGNIQSTNTRTVIWKGHKDYSYSGKYHHKASPFTSNDKDIVDLLDVVTEDLIVEGIIPESYDNSMGYFNSVLINVFDDGGSIPRHTDAEDIFRDVDGNVGVIASITLEGSSTITVYKGRDTSPIAQVEASAGSIYVMPSQLNGDNFQNKYAHAVGGAKGKRISLTLRRMPYKGENIYTGEIPSNFETISQAIEERQYSDPELVLEIGRAFMESRSSNSTEDTQSNNPESNTQENTSTDKSVDDSPFQRSSPLDSATTNLELFSKLKTQMMAIFPQIKLKYVEELVDEYGEKVLGRAFNDLVMYSRASALDTIVHEYAHIYIKLFRDTDIVKAGIKAYEGSEEALVQAIGEEVVKREGKAQTWWKSFTNWLALTINNYTKGIYSLHRNNLTTLLTDAFLENKNLKLVEKDLKNKYNGINKELNDNIVAGKFPAEVTKYLRKLSKTDRDNVREVLQKVYKSTKPRTYKNLLDWLKATYPVNTDPVGKLQDDKTDQNVSKLRAAIEELNTDDIAYRAMECDGSACISVSDYITKFLRGKGFYAEAGNTTAIQRTSDMQYKEGYHKKTYVLTDNGLYTVDIPQNHYMVYDTYTGAIEIDIDRGIELNDITIGKADSNETLTINERINGKTNPNYTYVKSGKNASIKVIKDTGNRVTVSSNINKDSLNMSPPLSDKLKDALLKTDSLVKQFKEECK